MVNFLSIIFTSEYYIYIHTYTCIRICIHTYTCIRIRIHTYMYTHVYVYVYTRIHTYVCVGMSDTYTYTPLGISSLLLELIVTLGRSYQQHLNLITRLKNNTNKSPQTLIEGLDQIFLFIDEKTKGPTVTLNSNTLSCFLGVGSHTSRGSFLELKLRTQWNVIFRVNSKSCNEVSPSLG